MIVIHLIAMSICMTLLASPPSSLNGADKIITASTLEEIESNLSILPEGAIIFLDVDDTIITPQSTAFRSSSPFRDIIDQIKKQRDKIPHVEMILSHWRLQRKSMLVSEQWPALIKTLKKHYEVYALTKLETGRVGDIPSMEKWRYEELKAKGVTFTPTCPGVSEGVLIQDASHPYPATFYRGIFITGSFNKSDVISAFVKTKRPPLIVLVDDRLEYLQDANQACNREGLHFIGVLFKGVEHIPGTPDPKVAEFQKQYLLEHAQWLEDEEARKILENSSSALVL